MDVFVCILLVRDILRIRAWVVQVATHIAIIIALFGKKALLVEKQSEEGEQSVCNSSLDHEFYKKFGG